MRKTDIARGTTVLFPDFGWCPSIIVDPKLHARSMYRRRGGSYERVDLVQIVVMHGNAYGNVKYSVEMRPYQGLRLLEGVFAERMDWEASIQDDLRQRQETLTVIANEKSLVLQECMAAMESIAADDMEITAEGLKVTIPFIKDHDPHLMWAVETLHKLRKMQEMLSKMRQDDPLEFGPTEGEWRMSGSRRHLDPADLFTLKLYESFKTDRAFYDEQVAKALGAPKLSGIEES